MAAKAPETVRTRNAISPKIQSSSHKNVAIRRSFVSDEINRTTMLIGIAIMRDGVVVQIGTPEDIVMHPADDYVADFVAGISRLKVVRAHAVMQPIELYEKNNGALVDSAPEFGEDDNLSVLISSAIKSDIPLAIVGQNKTRIGVVTKADLLRTVIEGTETS